MAVGDEDTSQLVSLPAQRSDVGEDGWGVARPACVDEGKVLAFQQVCVGSLDAGNPVDTWKDF